MFPQIIYRQSLPILFLALLLMAACTGKDKKADAGITTNDLFFDYQVSAEEGNDNLTVLLLYRVRDEEGDGITIREPGKVMLDGEVLPADSNKMTGTFYELHKLIADFAGKHTIDFSGADGVHYKEDFTFQPVVLQTAVADTIPRSDLVFEFTGLEEKDFVRILMTDTSFANNGINRVDAVVNGRLVIAAGDLKYLANGPVQAEFIREYEKPVSNGTKQGGRLLITYSLKREFVLRD